MRLHFSNDNGLSQTSDEFQRIVGENMEFWDKTSLHFFLLWHGRIVLCKKATINQTNTDIGSDSKTDKTLVEFPWPMSNMKKIGSCIKSKPLLSHFSLLWLEETERPYHYLIDKSTMQGAIDESIWQKQANNHWLSTAEIQMLSAVMMQNTNENKFIHFFLLMITMMMKETYELYDQIKCEDRTELCEKLKGHLQYL